MFIQRLNALMKERNISRARLSSDIGFGINQIKYWEKNGNTPSADTVKKLADYFDVSVDYLLGISDVRKATPDGTSDNTLSEYLEELKNRPEMRMLFSLAKGATKEDVEQAVAIIEALRKTNHE